MSRQGKRNFRNCGVKAIETLTYLEDPNTNETFIRRSSDTTSTTTRAYNRLGYGALLKCHRVEELDVEIRSNGVTFPDRRDAANNLRAVAASMICDTCIYSGQTPVQVSIMRRELAVAERERIEAQLALEAARAEIEAIHPAALPELPTPETA